MKILIVDDELHVQEAIKISIDRSRFQKLEILCADNGLQAFEILQNVPIDIVFCDMRMPVMDGVQLLEKIKQLDLNIHIIAVSGYDDFTYTRAAILANGVDYILKPFTAKAINDAMGLAIKRMDGHKEVARKDKEAHKANLLLGMQTITKWINDDFYDGQFLTQILEKRGMTNREYGVTVILPMNGTTICLDLFDDDQDLFYFAIRNMIYETYQDIEDVEFFPIEKNLWVVYYSHNRGEAYSRHKDQQVIDNLYQALNLKFISSSDREMLHVLKLPERVMALKKELLRIPLINHKDSNIQEEHHFLELEVAIEMALKHNNIGAIHKLVKGFCQDMRKLPIVSLGQLQIYTAEANLMYKRVYDGRRDKLIAQNNVSPWICNIDEWETAVIEMFSALTQGISQEDIISKNIHMYLVENYTNNLNLSDLAMQFHISIQHLSRIYKSAYGLTVMSAIVQMRIETAKNLLTDTLIPINEIARKVGYEDDNYFSKVFKKKMGCSPNSYRKKMDR